MIGIEGDDAEGAEAGEHRRPVGVGAGHQPALRADTSAAVEDAVARPIVVHRRAPDDLAIVLDRLRLRLGGAVLRGGEVERMWVRLEHDAGHAAHQTGRQVAAVDVELARDTHGARVRDVDDGDVGGRRDGRPLRDRGGIAISQGDEAVAGQQQLLRRVEREGTQHAGRALDRDRPQPAVGQGVQATAVGLGPVGLVHPSLLDVRPRVVLCQPCWGDGRALGCGLRGRRRRLRFHGDPADVRNDAVAGDR